MSSFDAKIGSRADKTAGAGATATATAAQVRLKVASCFPLPLLLGLKRGASSSCFLVFVMTIRKLIGHVIHGE